MLALHVSAVAEGEQSLGEVDWSDITEAGRVVKGQRVQSRDTWGYAWLCHLFARCPWVS